MSSQAATGTPAERVREAFGAVRLLASLPDRGWQAVMRIEREALVTARSADEVVAMIGREIERVPAAVLDSADWILTIPATGPGGFPIELSRHGARVRALFGELEEEFETLSGAMVWVARALSDQYRLRITLVAGRAREWSLEPITRREPREALSAGHVIWFRWLRPVTTVIRRNTFLAASRRVAVDE